jgi:hypothetical protein
MSTLTLPNRLPGQSFEAYVEECFKEIDKASYEDVAEAVADFETTGTLTERRTINAGTATLAELRDFVCTLISDIKKQGQKRTYGD